MSIRPVGLVFMCHSYIDVRYRAHHTLLSYMHLDAEVLFVIACYPQNRPLKAYKLIAGMKKKSSWIQSQVIYLIKRHARKSVKKEVMIKDEDGGWICHDFRLYNRDYILCVIMYKQYRIILKGFQK